MKPQRPIDWNTGLPDQEFSRSYLGIFENSGSLLLRAFANFHVQATSFLDIALWIVISFGKSG
jgi:hypothetical protein